MSKVKKQPSFKAYAAMWIAIIAAYAVWMIAFMRKIVLVNYATVEERTVDGITHANISGMMGHEWLYPIWVAVSCICLAMFIVYIRVLLYGKEPGKALKYSASSALSSAASMSHGTASSATSPSSKR